MSKENIYLIPILAADYSIEKKRTCGREYGYSILGLAFVLLIAVLSLATVSLDDGEGEEESFLARHCPMPELQAVIRNIDCSGTPLECARSARAVAQGLFVNEPLHKGYAWGALVIRINSSISDQIALSMNAVKPSGWFCTALSKSQTYAVHVFRTGYRYRNSTEDQWTYLANRQHRTEVCPLLALKTYINQFDQPTDASSFVSNLLKYAKIEYPTGKFDHEQWNVIVATPPGRTLLGRDFDFSFPVYLHNGLAAWCMMSTPNGWLAVIAKIGYADANEEGLSRNKRHINRNS